LAVSTATVEIRSREQGELPHSTRRYHFRGFRKNLFTAMLEILSFFVRRCYDFLNIRPCSVSSEPISS
jgi:hypothetical protein